MFKEVALFHPFKAKWYGTLLTLYVKMEYGELELVVTPLSIKGP